MAETQTAPTDGRTTQADPKTTANNIADGIKNRANGRPSIPPPPNKEKASSTGSPETPEVVDPNAGKEKYVVNGKEIYLTPEQARAYVQKGIAFEPRVDELARLRTETNQFLQTLASDPIKILTDKRIGLTPDTVMQKIFASGQISDQLKETVGKWYYENVIAPMKMTPEQLKAREDAKWREEHETKEKTREEQLIAQQNQQKFEMALNQIKANIAEAMKESGLPSNDTPLGAEMARMVADVMRVAHFQRQALTPKQAIEFVKQRIKAVQTAYYDSLEEEELVKEIGEKNAEKVKKYFLKLAKDAGKEIPPNQKAAATPKGQRKGVMGLDQFHDYLDDLKKKS